MKNLTPHVIRIFSVTDVLITSIPPDGRVARVEVVRKFAGDVEGIPTYSVIYGDVTGLPPVSGSETYIVSQMVRVACPGRMDIYSPAELVRVAGEVVGCHGLDGNGGTA